MNFQKQYADNLSGVSRGIPIYKPLSLREAKVGDVAYFDPKTGQYRLIVNAFHTEELRRRGWPIFTVPESVSVSDDSCENFRLAVGGSATITKMEFEAGALTPVFPGVGVGGFFHIALSENGGSMSVLVIEQAGPLRRRWTSHEQEYHLFHWFVSVQAMAWEFVNQYYPASRPDKIFLVRGQLLTAAYAISHRGDHDSGCEVTIESDVQVPQFVDTKALMGWGLKRAWATAGFEHRTVESDGCAYWSIFLENCDCGPMKQFSLGMFPPANRNKAEKQLTYLRRANSNWSTKFGRRSFDKVLFPWQENYETFQLSLSPATEPELRPLQQPDSMCIDESLNVSDMILSDADIRDQDGKQVQKRLGPLLERIPLQQEPNCNWYLYVYDGDEFAIQYSGPDTSGIFPEDFSGNQVLELLQEFSDSVDSDISAHIRVVQEEVDSTSQGDPDRAELLNDLGRAHQSRYDQTHSVEDITSAIRAYDDSIRCLPSDCSAIERAEYLNDLATALRDLFDVSPSIEVIDHSIEKFEEAVAYADEANDPDRYLYFYNLGNALEERVQITNQMEDLDRTITAYEKACNFSPRDEIEKLVYYNHLGGALLIRFERRRSTKDLDEAVAAYEQAVQYAEDSSERSLYLSQLGHTLHLRSEAHNSSADLYKALEYFDLAIGSVVNVQYSANITGSFADALQLLFRRTGDVESLNRAISLYRHAVTVSSLEDINYDVCRCNLGNALQRRYLWSGSMDDLEGAMDEYDAALKASRDTGNAVHILTGFGMAKRHRFLHDGLNETIRYLNEAIDLFVLALANAPPGHNVRAICLHNLGSALLSRFELINSPQDHNQARKYHSEALKYASNLEGDLNRGRYSHSLALVLFKAYFLSQKGDTELLDEAISLYDEALRCTSSSQPEYAVYLISFGQALKSRYDHASPNNPKDLKKSTEAFNLACYSSAASPTVRVVAVLCLAQQLEEVSCALANRALQTAIELLPSIASYNLWWIDRQYNMTGCLWLASIATAVALSAGEDPATAACLLDAGRGIILGRLLDLRGDITALRTDLAEKHRSLTAILDPEFLGSDLTAFTAAELMDMRHQAAVQFDLLKNEIRQQQGFEDFAMPITPQDLMDQASSGPIVLINVHSSRSDVFLITSQTIVTEPLPNITIESMKPLVENFHQSIQRVIQGHQLGDIDQTRQGEAQISKTLEWLWDHIAEPILAKLGFTNTPVDSDYSNWPKIWWCPTGPLSYLPLHAAGYHRDVRHGPNRCVIDRVVSAYTPTIRAMKHARRISTTSESVKLDVLIAATTPRELRLAEIEAEIVRKILASPGYTVDVISGVTREQLSNALPNYNIEHFICHAMSDVDPSKSRLNLTNGEVMYLPEFAQANFKKGSLAYLSACSTALNRGGLLGDEALTLTSAFQIAGFARVVGTLWDVDDLVSLEIGKRFYATMGTDISKAALALHTAVREVRKVKLDEPSDWSPYIYTGC